ncbi:MAG: ZIP family metal transporter [Candidatus Obscuribacterales bacterium]|nr:ZIP family metal transporter [Candidatus Obscuribacterales bacterium]
MVENLIYALTAALIISTVSLIGVSTLALSQTRLTKVLPYLVALAAGAMLGNALLHMVPHSLERSFNQSVPSVVSPAAEHDQAHKHEHDRAHDHEHDQAHDHEHDQAHKHEHDQAHDHEHDQAHKHEHGHVHGHAGLNVVLLLLAGFLSIFAIDLGLISNIHKSSSNRSLGYLVLVSDGLENFMDGIVIGTTFMIDPALGIATSIAIFLHEVPMELGDFAVLTNSGFTTRKALLMNFGSALLNVGGVLLAFVAANFTDSFTATATPLAAGAFLYLASAGLIAKLRSDEFQANKAGLFAMVLLGLFLMYLIMFLE